MKNLHFITALPLALLFAALTGYSFPLQQKKQSNPSEPPRIRLKVMSYNIRGLPSSIVGGEWKDERYSIIGRLLADRSKEGTGPDLILLQEVFSVESRMVEKKASYPYRAEGPGASSLLGVSSGLVILSKYPIEKSASREFGRGNCAGWDCLSNKGVQFARIAIPGLPRPVEVFNTHMQAGRNDTSVRRNQVKVLLEFFSKHHEPGNPVIFAGDFNFRPGSGQQSYLDFSQATGFTHAGKYCIDNGCAEGPDSGWHGIWERAVDHQFFSVRGNAQIVPTRVRRTYKERVENLRLSDHPAYEVVYEITYQPGNGGRNIAQESGKVKEEKLRP